MGVSVCILAFLARRHSPRVLGGYPCFMKKCPWCGQQYPDEAVICATDRNTLQPCDPETSAAGSKPQDFKNTMVHVAEAADLCSGDDPFFPLVRFDATEAARLLQRFEQGGVRFQIERVDRRVRSLESSRTVGMIQIYVHRDDKQRAMEIFSADWKV